MKRLLLLLSLFSVTGAQGDEWPQWMGPKRDNVWREDGIIEKFPEKGATIAWKAKIAGGYSGPAVANGRVIVADYLSDVDPKSETYDRTNHVGKERVLAFDEKTGKELWKFEREAKYTISFPCGPRTTCSINDGKVYFLGAEGFLVCLNEKTGAEIWSKDLNKTYNTKTPLWGYASHPLIEGKLLISLVGGEKSAVVAFDKDTGKEIWKNLTTTEIGYGVPVIMELQGKNQVVLWHAESINGLSLENGERLWNSPLKPTNGASIMAPVKSGDYFFAGGYQGICKGYKVNSDKPGITELWTGDKKNKGIYPVNGQPIVDGELLFGICTMGELRCMEVATGKRLWETTDIFKDKNGKTKAGQCASAFLVKHDSRYFIFTEQGELIIASLTKDGYKEISRAKVLDTTASVMGRDCVYCSPAFANKHMFVRSDKEIVSISLAK